MTPIHRLFASRAAGRAGFTIVAVLMGAALGPALADEAPAVDAEALAKCSRIADKEARLVCFDAVAEAVAATRKAEEEAVEAAAADAKADAARKEAEARAKAEAARAAQAAREAVKDAEARAADIAAREAELARREAEFARRQAEAERAAAELEAERARVREARERQQTEIAERDKEIARKDALIQRNRDLVANRLPQTLPILFGIGDLAPEQAARVAKGLDYEQIFTGTKELDRIELKVVKFGFANTGKAYVVLEDGQMWRQKDSQHVLVTREGPKTCEVKRGTMGSYFMRLDGRGTAYRAERIR